MEITAKWFSFLSCQRRQKLPKPKAHVSNRNEMNRFSFRYEWLSDIHDSHSFSLPISICIWMTRTRYGKWEKKRTENESEKSDWCRWMDESMNLATKAVCSFNLFVCWAEKLERLFFSVEKTIKVDNAWMKYIRKRPRESLQFKRRTIAMSKWINSKSSLTK